MRSFHERRLTTGHPALEPMAVPWRGLALVGLLLAGLWAASQLAGLAAWAWEHLLFPLRLIAGGLKALLFW